MTDVELLNAAIQLGAHPRPPVGSVVRLVNVKSFDVMAGYVYSQVVVGSLNPDQPSLFGKQPLRPCLDRAILLGLHRARVHLAPERGLRAGRPGRRALDGEVEVTSSCGRLEGRCPCLTTR